MKDRKLEDKIKKVRDFSELWSKFEELYSTAQKVKAEDRVNGEGFRRTRDLVTNRFEDLLDDLGVKPLNRFFKTYFFYDILFLDNTRDMSDGKIKNLEENWKESRKFLNATIKRLERKKKRLKGINPFLIGLKTMLSRKRRPAYKSKPRWK